MCVCVWEGGGGGGGVRESILVPPCYQLTSKSSHFRQSSVNCLSLTGLLSNMKSTEIQSLRPAVWLSRLPGGTLGIQPRGENVSFSTRYLHVD